MTSLSSRENKKKSSVTEHSKKAKRNFTEDSKILNQMSNIAIPWNVELEQKLTDVRRYALYKKIVKSQRVWKKLSAQNSVS